MKAVKVSEPKAGLSNYLAKVKRGEQVVVTERGKSVAKLAPLPPRPEGEAALRALRVHSLSAGDAFQLAAALEWAEGRAGGRVLVTLDRELGEAARLEGFTILPA
jgi:prevent-host-death family protein